MASSDPAEEALAALDRALEQRPRKDGADFSRASMCLAAMRNQMAARGDMPDELDRLNGVISVVVGAQFPLGPIPWDGVRAARDALAKVAARWRAAG